PRPTSLAQFARLPVVVAVASAAPVRGRPPAFHPARGRVLPEVSRSRTSQRSRTASNPGVATRPRLTRTAAGIRRWFRPPRRLKFSRAGWLFTGGTLVLGLAAIGTGNNLLYLVLGAMLGFITLSGWLSEQMIRRLEVRRRPVRGFTAGQPGR